MDDDHECYDNWQGGYEDGNISMWREVMDALRALDAEKREDLWGATEAALRVVAALEPPY